MSLEIKVDPDAVKSLTAKARLVPNERIDQTLGELEELESTLSGWKVDDFSKVDDEISSRFEITVENYTADE